MQGMWVPSLSQGRSCTLPGAAKEKKKRASFFLHFPATLFPGILYQKTATFPTSIPHSFLPNGFPWKSEIHSDVCGHSLAGCFLYVTSGIFQLHPDVDVGKNPDSDGENRYSLAYSVKEMQEFYRITNKY